LFRIPAKNKTKASAPKQAQAGMTEAAVRATGHQIKALRWWFHDNDRALTDGQTLA